MLELAFLSLEMDEAIDRDWESNIDNTYNEYFDYFVIIQVYIVLIIKNILIFESHLEP